MKILQFTKKSLAFIFIAIFAILAQFTIIYAASNSYYTYAYTQDTTSDMLSNANFESSSSTSKGNPSNPSYWVTAGGDSENVSKGVIDTTNDTFNNNSGYGISSNPLTSSSASDKKILMINSREQETRYGYKNSSEMNLKANSYYRISVLCKTNTVSNGASIYLTGSDLPLTKQYNFVDVVTNKNVDNGWATYNFYVKTDINSSTKAYLELWLGSKQDNNVLSNGQVFFDNIKVQSIDQTTYYACTEAYNFDDINNMPSNIRKLDLAGKDYENQFTNSDFEAGLDGWTRSTSSGNEKTHSGITLAGNSTEMLNDMYLDSDQAVPGNTFSYNNTKALFINHLDTNGSYTEYTSNPITIKQHSFAMITYYSKTGNVTKGGAYATVKTTSTDEDAPKVTVADYTTTSTGLANYNNYALTTIYVEGNPYRDVDITLSLGLGKTDSLATGYVIFDDIKVYEISYSTYNNASSNKLALYTDSDTTTIKNGAFNYSGTTDSDVNYPIKARNWSISNEISGIININKTKYDANLALGNYGPNAVYPGPVTTYPNVDTNPETTVNNLLMLRNDEKNSYVTATSDSFSVGESSSIAVSVYVKVQSNLSNLSSGASISLISGKNVYARISGIRATEWTKYTIYFKNTTTSLDMQLVLSLGTENNTTSGYAYFDNVSYTSSVEDSVIESRDTATSTYTNLQNNNFDSYIDNGSNIYTPSTMTADTDSEASTAGVINTSTAPEMVVNANVPTREGSNGNLLMIKNNAPTAFTYKTNYTYTFNTDTHYVVNVWIYTTAITGTEEEYGVNIALSNVEKSFSNVVSKVTDGENVWTKYSFYVSNDQSNSITSTLSISLGNKDYPTQGFVFVDSITVDTVTATDYNAVESNDYTIKTVAKVTESTDDSSNDDTTPSISNVNYWILASSLIIALALIIAIVGMAMRHLKFRMPKRYGKGKKSDYNRELSLNDADVRRELKALRDEKVKELDKKIEETKAQMDADKLAYEESIKGLDNEQKVERLFTKYARNNSKLQKEIDNFESAKKYLLDEANIRLEEQKEIRRRQMLLDEENRLIKQNQAAIEKEKQKEKQEQEAKAEAGKQKARLKSKK